MRYIVFTSVGAKEVNEEEAMIAALEGYMVDDADVYYDRIEIMCTMKDEEGKTLGITQAYARDIYGHVFHPDNPYGGKHNE